MIIVLTTIIIIVTISLQNSCVSLFDGMMMVMNNK